MSNISSFPNIAKFGGVSKRIMRFVNVENKHWSAFNPSIAMNANGDIAMAIRSSNYLLGDMQLYTSLTTGSDIINHLWFAEMNKNLEITALKKIEVVGELSFIRGIEDARLFWRDDSWHVVAVILEKAHTRVARLGLFRIDSETCTAHFVEKYEGPEEKRVEKNWSVVSGNSVPEFDFIYAPNKIYKSGKITQLNLEEQYQNLRGGTQLIPWGDKYLSVSHIMNGKKKKVFNTRTFAVEYPKLRSYTHVFVVHNKDGSIENVSQEFVFGELEVEFAAGIIEIDGNLVISWGQDDASSWLTKISVEDVQRMLR